MSAPSNNPYSRGYAAIWAAFNAWPAWTALVKPGNREDEQVPGWRPPAGNKDAPADRGEVSLLQRRMRIKPFSKNATHVAFGSAYILQVESGKFGPDLMNLMIIESMRALIAADPQQGKLGIPDILVDWDVSDITATPTDSSPGKRPEWSAVASINLSFSMNRKDFMEAQFT